MLLHNDSGIPSIRLKIITYYKTGSLATVSAERVIKKYLKTNKLLKMLIMFVCIQYF